MGRVRHILVVTALAVPASLAAQGQQQLQVTDRLRAADTTAIVRVAAIRAQLDELARYQQMYYLATGRYTAAPDQAPGYRGPLAGLSVVAGSDWWVGLVVDSAVGTLQYAGSWTPEPLPTAATPSEAALAYLLAHVDVAELRAREGAACLRLRGPLTETPLGSDTGEDLIRAAAAAGLASCERSPPRTGGAGGELYIEMSPRGEPTTDPWQRRIEVGVHHSYHGVPGDGGWTRFWSLELRQCEGRWQVSRALPGSDG